MPQTEYNQQQSVDFSLVSDNFPLVSVIIRSIDRPTLSEALESVALQAYPNIEVIVVNAKGDQHSQLPVTCGTFPLRIINTGSALRRSQAGNIGLKNAKGKYLIFLDDDDWFIPEHISVLVNTIMLNPGKTTAYSGVLGVNEKKEPTGNYFCHSFDRLQLLLGNYIPVHAVLFSRIVVEEGCRMDESLDLYEDWDFWLQVATFGDFIFVNQLTAYYRIGGESGQGTRPDKMIAEQVNERLFVKWRQKINRTDLLNLVNHAHSLETRLNEIKSERDSAITERYVLEENLNYIISERNRQINYLLEQEHEQRNVVNNLRVITDELRNEIHAFRSSTSWQITKPLRNISLMQQRIIILIQLYRNYRCLYPGIHGIRRLTNRLIDSIRKGGFKTLRSNIALHVKSRQTIPQIQPALNPVLTLNDDHSHDNIQHLPDDVAVHIHLFYTDLAEEMVSYLANIPVSFHCYVTTDTQEKISSIETVFSKISQILTLDIRVVENRGRDIAPMLVYLGQALTQHDVVLHIHSKRSPHNLALRGWRRYLMQTLLGNSQRVRAILQQFADHKKLGILFPEIYHPVIPLMKIGGNAPYIEKLLNHAGIGREQMQHINPTDFPAGSMFWFRGKAIEPFVNMQLNLRDFDKETGQCDATLAHAIERLFPYFANKIGLYHQTYKATQFSSSVQGAASLNAFNDYHNNGLIANPTILFDHNIGGGTNRYSRELINSLVTKINSVVRIYQDNQNWFIQWIAEDDGLIFCVSSSDMLFESLARLDCQNIIVNSVYGYSDIDSIIEQIIMLVDQLKARLDYKFHDFYAVCPSQHLINLHESYCGVPSNHSECNACLKTNPAAYWTSSRPVDINEWRSPFTKLLNRADLISVFDPSSIKILDKAFHLDKSKLNTTPHNDSYFRCDHPVSLSGRLHIGLIGTLTPIKGATIVNGLAEYFAQQEIYVPITVVGQSLVNTAQNIKVFGAYENEQLPNILKQEGINVILMPTIVPETFSYTISETIKMELPIVAFNIGAQGNRIKNYRLGKVIPLNASPNEIWMAIQSVYNMATEFKK